MNRNLYGIMIKYPEPGRVKTRLAKDFGIEKAAEICRHVAEQILKQTDPVSFSHHPVQCHTLKKGGWGDFNENSRNRKISPIPSLPKRGISENCSGDELNPGFYERVIFYDPPERLYDFEQWLGHEQFVPQYGHNVGERMDHAIRVLLDRGAEKAVLTGADIPELNEAIIIGAFAALDNADVVIGPAKDGGYYLIGMKSPHPDIFSNIAWSTPKVYAKTVEIIEDLNLNFRCIETLSDLDTSDDYNKLLIQNAHRTPEMIS